jgi:hypothetical protein
MQARTPGITFPVFAGLAVIAVFFQAEWLGAREYIFTSNVDNQDIILPLHLYFLESIQQGQLPAFLPYIWSGTRLIGDPNFQLSPLHVLAALTLTPERYLDFLSIWAFLAVCGSFLGVYCLMRVLLSDRSRWLATAGGLLYIFSTGFLIARSFTNTEFAFLAIPWCWYFLYINRPALAVRNAVLIAVILWFQFSYGQLQFSIYAAWLVLLFALFVPDRKHRRINLYTVLIAGGCATVLASYYLIPVIDNLTTHGGAAEDRLFGFQSLTEQMVHPVYFLRLLFPSLFGWQYPETGMLAEAARAVGIARQDAIPWWPVWKDGWSYWESFSAYQGSVVTIVVLFGVLFLKDDWFWRAGYASLILAVTTQAGAMLLFLVHLGTGVPYGRITVLLGLFAIVVFVKTLLMILETRRMQVAFAIYLCVIAVATLVLSQVGLSKWLVQQTFSQASLDMGSFYAQHVAAFKVAIRNHGIFIFGAAVVVACCVMLMNVLHRKAQVRAAKVAVVAGLTCITLVDAISYYDGGRLSDMQGAVARRMAFMPHATEAALAEDGADFNLYRLHLDMPFAAHREAAYESTDTGASSHGLSRRWIPDRPILAHIAITAGYSSVIPDGAAYTELLNWREGARDFRAQGDYSVLHPALFDVLAIRYVLRQKVEPTRDIDWRPAALGRSEKEFQKRAKLLYEDKAYRLYKYVDAPGIFYFPRRIVYTDSPVRSALKLSTDRWETTGFLSLERRTADGRRPSIRSDGEEQQAQNEVVSAQPVGDEWSLRLRAKSTGYLFAGLRYDPWWKASIDGRPVTPIRANGAFMAISVPAGDHAATFRLAPASVWWGISVTLIGFCAGLLFLLGSFIFRRVRRRTGP